MNDRERFIRLMSFQPVDRLPRIEWASWWDKTLTRWHGEGLDPSLGGAGLFRHFGLDVLRQYWLPTNAAGCPAPAYHGAPLITDEAGYEALLPHLYPRESMEPLFADMAAVEAREDRGDTVLWFTLSGAFWFPRQLLGIENHLYSFYDEPALYRRILNDLADYQLWQLDRLYRVCTPEFMTIAEDMSYNNGPMISEEMFREFLAPYYRRIVPVVRSHGTRVLVDSDGDVTRMIPWLESVGVEGILPLERQAGVDVARLREAHPRFLMIGAFDKMTMWRGEDAMRREFERLLPVMRQGGFIPSVDHQTPPQVSLEQYGLYLRLLREYTERAAER